MSMADFARRLGRLTSLVVALAIVAAGLAVLLTIGQPATVLAANTTCDQSSLQTALNSAPADGTPYTITFASGCAIQLISTLNVGSNVNITIDGNGLVLIGQGSAFHVIQINDGSGASTLTLNGVTLQNGLMGISDPNQVSTVNLSASAVINSWEAGVVAGSATVNASTITGSGGAGLYAGSATVTDSTVTGNFSSGIYASDHATVTSSTISNNGSSYGNGIQAGSMTLTATVLSGNPRGNCSGSAGDGGYNLSTDASCNFGPTSTSKNNVTGLDLQGLANNGGPTPTRAIDSSSTAKDQIPVSNGACIVGAQVDQRGVNRPQGSGCDVGAYELIQGAATLTASVCPTQAVLQSDFDLASQTNEALLTINLPPNCTLDLTSSLNVGAGVDITINGNGLTLNQTISTDDVIAINDSSNPSTLTLDQVTVEGGRNGVADPNFLATVSLIASTVSGNHGDGIQASSATVTNSTISGNTGSGIDASFTATVTSSTIAHNQGYGIYIQNVAATATMTATILADNPSGNCFIGALLDGGYNLSTDTTCSLSGASQQGSAVADGLQLLPLGNYGGPTPTIALGPGSIAIDAIPISDCVRFTYPDGSQIKTDQRGIDRPQGAGCDSGAYEAPALSLAIDPSTPNGQNGWYVTDPTVTLGYSGLAVGQDANGAPLAQIASCTELSGLSHTATGLNDSGSVQATVTTDGDYAFACGVNQGSTALGTSYPGFPTATSLALRFHVDTVPPSVSITTPEATSYALHQTVDADYGCSDATSQIATTNGCVGTVPNGQPIDTSTVGSHTFTVNTTDQAGNTASKSVTYTVGYQITTLPGSTTTVSRGYYAVIRFAPEDANGHDLASRNLKVTAIELDGPGGQVIPFAYPFQYGTFSGKAGYQLSINTRNLTSGTWTLKVQIGSGASATTGTVTFTVQ